MNIMLMIFSFNTGGIERQMIDMTRAMQAKGHHVSICIINEDYTPSLLKEFPDETPIYILHKKAGTRNFLPYMQKLSRVITKDHTEVLHCQGINCVLFAAVAKFWHPHLAVLNTVHACGNYPSYSAGKIFLQNRICSMTIAISKAIEQEILTRNVPKDRVTVIYNAIDTDKFQYDPEKRRPAPVLTPAAPDGSPDAADSDKAGSPAFNRNLSDPVHGAIEIGQVARIYPAQKGQDTLVHAILKLTGKYPGIHCTFAGDLFKGQRQAYEDLLSEIRAAHAEDHFSFPGNVEDVPGFLQKLDIFVLPSHTEGFGIALVEAMAAGLPCIASRLAGPEEIINDPRLGILFTPGDADDLARAIDHMILHRADYDPAFISANVTKRFNINDMVDRHLELYQRLLMQ